MNAIQLFLEQHETVHGSIEEMVLGAIVRDRAPC